MKRRSLLLCAALLPAAGLCADPPVDTAALMARVDKQSRPAFERARLRMELRGDGPPIVRELDAYNQTGNGTRISVLKFLAPANVQSVGLMVVEEAGTTTAIWHYLPATRNMRRISSEHRQNRFMGTELVFEDFEGLKLDKYRFDWLRAEPCAAAGAEGRCQVIEARATDARESQTSSYGRKVFWISAERESIVKTELYGRDGQLFKVFESEDFRLVGNAWRAHRQTMRHLGSGRQTVIEEITRQVNVPFDPYHVSQQFLRSE